MVDTNWEDMISLNSRAEVTEVALGAPRDYLQQDAGEVRWDRQRIPLEQALASDTAPLPTTEQREGYYGPNHFNYWASGLRDYCQLLEWLEPNQVARGTLLDIGCATGRLIRHATPMPIAIPASAKWWDATSTARTSTGLGGFFQLASRFFRAPAYRPCHYPTRASTW